MIPNITNPIESEKNYFPEENAPSRKKLFFCRPIEPSSINYGKRTFIYQEDRKVDLWKIIGQSADMPPIKHISEIWPFYKSDFSPPTKSILTNEISIEEIVIVPIREIPRDYAKIEISNYVKKAGRKVYISELAKKLNLDIELIMEIMEELERES